MIDNIGLVEDIISAVRKNDYFKNIRLVSAYPKVNKPTLLKAAVIAFSCRRADAKAVALGEAAGAGNVTLSANIYVPFINKEITGNEIAKMLCSVVLKELNVTAVNASAPFADGETECIVTKIAFSLNDEFDFGGVDNE